MKTAIVVKNYDPKSDQDIRLIEGELVTIYEVDMNLGWAKGEVIDFFNSYPRAKGSLVGWFPYCFVKPFKSDEFRDSSVTLDVQSPRLKEQNINHVKPSIQSNQSLKQDTKASIHKKIIRIIDRCKRKNETSISFEFLRLKHFSEESFKLLRGFTKISFAHNELNFLDIGKLAAENDDIVHLSLDNNQIFEVTHLGSLINLAVLSASKNRISTFPDDIHKLRDIMVINLSMNRISTVPVEIKGLENLTILKLSSNNFSAIPNVIFTMTKLEYLDFRHNNIVSLSESIRKLVNLRALLLSDNQLVSIPEEICFLPNLSSLRLHNNRLNSIPYEILTLWGTLKEITLWHNNFPTNSQIRADSNNTDILFDSLRMDSIPAYNNLVQDLESNHGALFTMRNLHASDHLKTINNSISQEFTEILKNEESREMFCCFLNKRLHEWSVLYYFWLDVQNWKKLIPEKRTFPALFIYILYIKKNTLKFPDSLFFELRVRFAKSLNKITQSSTPLIIDEIAHSSLFKYPEKYAILQLDMHCLPSFLSWRGVNSRSLTYLSKKEEYIKGWLQMVLKDGTFRHVLTLLDIVSDGVILIRVYNNLIMSKNYEKIVYPDSKHIWKTAKTNIKTFLKAMVAKGIDKKSLFKFSDIKKKNEKKVILGMYNFMLFCSEHEEFMHVKFEGS